jgi:hypothetical protein
MDIPCQEYASTCFVTGPLSPRSQIANRALIFSPNPGIDRWFETDPALFGTESLGIGDLIVFKGMAHIVVATGWWDKVVQSGYNVQSAKEASRLRQLTDLRELGKLPEELPPNFQSGLRNLPRAATGADPYRRINPEFLELNRWQQAMGPSFVRLGLLTQIFDKKYTHLQVYRLKPEHYGLIDRHGPLGPYWAESCPPQR